MKLILFFIISILSFSLNASNNPLSAYNELKEGKAVFIDVREASEIEEGMINGAHWYPMSKITSGTRWIDDLKKITGDKKIYLYCRSGRRSENVKSILNSNGIKSMNLGGFETLKKILPIQKPIK